MALWTLTLVVALLAGFGGGWYLKPTASNLKAVTFGLDWLPGGTHSVFYTALDKGFYAEEGLAVTILRGYGSGDTATKVDTGKLDFGYADSTVSLIARGRGANLTLVGMFFHKGISGVRYVLGTGINAPIDLQGKTIGTVEGDSSWVLFPAFAQINNINMSKINVVIMTSALVTPALLGGQIDFSPGTVTLFPLAEASAKQAGKSLGKFVYSDYGLNWYSHSIIATQKMVAENPDLVQRFIRATYKGIAYSIDNPDESISILVKYNPDVNGTVERQVFDLTKAYMFDGLSDTEGLGHVNEAKMNATVNLVKQYFNVDPGNYKTVYTNQFVDLLPDASKFPLR